MKKEFIGFYNPTDEEVESAWKKGIICLDTNTLLNLYRYTSTTRNDFLAVLRGIKERLFIPHQVAFEYHTNRNRVIEDTNNAFSDLAETVKQNYDTKLSAQLKTFKRYRSISIDRIEKLFQAFLKDLDSELEKQKEQHTDFSKEDKILDELTKLFSKCVGKGFEQAELPAIYEEGNRRYQSMIPPGYKDGPSKKEDRHKYGDLIIWKELIKFANEKNQQIIFVTDDRKADWWTIQDGKTIRPREELIKEFFDLTGIRILIYNADQFLNFANIRKLAEVRTKTIFEVKTLRQSDEAFQTNYEAFFQSNIVSNMRRMASQFRPDLYPYMSPAGSFSDPIVAEHLKFNPDLSSYGTGPAGPSFTPSQNFSVALPIQQNDHLWGTSLSSVEGVTKPNEESGTPKENRESPNHPKESKQGEDK